MQPHELHVTDLAAQMPTLVDLISMDERLEGEFEPDRLGLTARMPEL